VFNRSTSSTPITAAVFLARFLAVTPMAAAPTRPQLQNHAGPAGLYAAAAGFDRGGDPGLAARIAASAGAC
jgi:hypothetical protein